MEQTASAKLYTTDQSLDLDLQWLPRKLYLCFPTQPGNDLAVTTVEYFYTQVVLSPQPTQT